MTNSIKRTKRQWDTNFEIIVFLFFLVDGGPHCLTGFHFHVQSSSVQSSQPVTSHLRLSGTVWLWHILMSYDLSCCSSSVRLESSGIYTKPVRSCLFNQLLKLSLRNFIHSLDRCYCVAKPLRPGFLVPRHGTVSWNSKTVLRKKIVGVVASPHFHFQSFFFLLQEHTGQEKVLGLEATDLHHSF